MELIKDLGTRLINGKWIRYGIFWCDGCKQEVEKRLDHGLRDKSCGCQQHSQEAGQKISKTRIERGVAKGEKNPFYGNKLFIGENNPFYGKKHTEETRQLMKDNHGDFSGENHPMFGKHQTEETRQKQSNSMKGRIVTEETRQKLSKVRKGITVSEETRKKQSEAHRGELAYNWQGGKSFEEYPIEFKQIKKSILKRDNYTCQCPDCEHKSNLLDAHHIDYNKKNNNPENLITLCRSCHAKTNGKNNRQYWAEYYQNIMRNKT